MRPGVVGRSGRAGGAARTVATRPATDPIADPAPARRRTGSDGLDPSFAEALGDGLRLDGIDPEPAQGVARHLHGELALSVDRLDLGADRPELSRLLVTVGANHEIERRIERLGSLDDQRAELRVAARDDDETCVRDIGALEQLDVGRLPEERWDAARAERFDLRPLLADHDVAEATTIERPGNEATDLPVPAQDRVQPQRR